MSVCVSERESEGGAQSQITRVCVGGVCLLWCVGVCCVDYGRAWWGRVGYGRVRWSRLWWSRLRLRG